VPLREAVAAGRFREDLALRLSGLVLRLPPLRERTDLPALARAMLADARAGDGPGAEPVLSPALLDLLARHPWPGNLRQLSSVLRTALALAAGEPVVTPAHLSGDFLESFGAASAAADAAHPNTGVSATATATNKTHPAAGGTLEESEARAIRAALDAAQGNVSRAARQLGISRNTIYRKLRLKPGE